MRAFLLRCLLFALVLGAVAWALDAMLMHGIRQRRTHTLGAWNRVVQGRMDAQVLFTGSSRCLMHFDAQAIGERTGLRCWNLGMDGTQLELQLGWLRTYLAHNPAPKVIVQNVDLISLTPDSGVFFPAQYPPYLNEPDVYRAVRSVDHTWWKDRWIPLYSFSRLGLPYAGLAISGLLGREDTLTDPLVLGHEKRDWPWDGTFDRFVKEHPHGITRPIDRRMVDVLRQIIRAGHEAGSHVVLVVVPELLEMQQFTINRTEVLAVFAQVAREEGALFRDLSCAADLCGERRWFYNSQHLNAGGVARFTPVVADSVSVWAAQPRMPS
ncbi:MAG: hypothetical protein JNM31_15710 [Flavobacteriales bacterium]|nr:hypothetical protein [Flavobacteriales bacterium]